MICAIKKKINLLVRKIEVGKGAILNGFARKGLFEEVLFEQQV